MKQKSWKQLSLVPNKTAEKPVPMTSFVLGSWWNTEQSMNCSWGVSKTSWCSRRTNCGLCWLRRASSLGASGGLLVQHWLNVAEQRGEKLRHSLIAWKRQRVYQNITVFASLCVRLLCTTAVPGKMLMSMTVRVCVCMLMMTSTPNRAMPSCTRSSLTRAATASELGGGRQGICSSSLEKRRREEDINPNRCLWLNYLQAVCAPYMMPLFCCFLEQFDIKHLN